MPLHRASLSDEKVNPVFSLTLLNFTSDEQDHDALRRHSPQPIRTPSDILSGKPPTSRGRKGIDEPEDHFVQITEGKNKRTSDKSLSWSSDCLPFTPLNTLDRQAPSIVHSKSLPSRLTTTSKRSAASLTHINSPSPTAVDLSDDKEEEGQVSSLFSAVRTASSRFVNTLRTSLTGKVNNQKAREEVRQSYKKERREGEVHSGAGEAVDLELEGDNSDFVQFRGRMSTDKVSPYFVPKRNIQDDDASHIMYPDEETPI